MSNQYFENNPNLIHDLHTIEYYFKGSTIYFLSDNGVFSKDKIDFGTSLLLQSLPQFVEQKILDVGCGIGVIGITVAIKNPTSKIDMVDINKNTIKLSSENIVKNKVENARAFESNTYEKIVEKYDTIISNPPIRAGKKVVHDIVLNAIDYLNSNGSIFVVIQEKQGANSLIKAMMNCYENVEIINKNKGYFIIKGTKE